MDNRKLKLQPVSFKSSQPGSYKKDFGESKDALRQQGFPTKETERFIESRISDKSLTKLAKNISPSTILVSLPTKEGKKAENIIPRLYAKALSERLGKEHVDLSDYISVRQNASARTSYSAKDRSENFFNIGFKNEATNLALGNKIGKANILLIDDVLTTGETMVAMATFLKYKFPETTIQGGNAMAAVDVRTPTPRDLDRVAEKLSSQLDPRISTNTIKQTLVDALLPFTRKKLMLDILMMLTPVPVMLTPL